MRGGAEIELGAVTEQPAAALTTELLCTLLNVNYAAVDILLLSLWYKLVDGNKCFTDWFGGQRASRLRRKVTGSQWGLDIGLRQFNRLYNYTIKLVLFLDWSWSEV